MFYNKFWTEQKLVVINKAQTKFTNSFIKSTTITTSLYDIICCFVYNTPNVLNYRIYSAYQFFVAFPWLLLFLTGLES